ncbi:hypothetical protein Mapa_003296 [Marchantia paleacea]|nr:hypothetical protein Mapa_003296 [Marchantia paleacea]
MKASPFFTIFAYTLLDMVGSLPKLLVTKPVYISPSNTYRISVAKLCVWGLMMPPGLMSSRMERQSLSVQSWPFSDEGEGCSSVGSKSTGICSFSKPRKCKVLCGSKCRQLARETI